MGWIGVGYVHIFSWNCSKPQMTFDCMLYVSTFKKGNLLATFNQTLQSLWPWRKSTHDFNSAMLMRLGTGLLKSDSFWLVLQLFGSTTSYKLYTRAGHCHLTYNAVAFASSKFAVSSPVIWFCSVESNCFIQQSLKRSSGLWNRCQSFPPMYIMASVFHKSSQELGGRYGMDSIGLLECLVFLYLLRGRFDIAPPSWSHRWTKMSPQKCNMTCWLLSIRKQFC